MILFSEDLLQAGVEGLATKGTVDDLTLRVDKDIVGDAINLIDGHSGTIPAFQVGDLQPRHLQLSDGLDPSRLPLVERNANHLKALGVITVPDSSSKPSVGTCSTISALILPLVAVVPQEQISRAVNMNEYVLCFIVLSHRLLPISG